VIPAAWYTEILQSVPQDALTFAGVTPAEGVTEPAVISALEEIRTAFKAATIPPAFQAKLETFLEQQGLARSTVSVRSSATAEDGARASFAGIHRSFLNVNGVEAIGQAILGCYASFWTPHALAYRRKMNFSDDDVLCAVAICEMVRAEGLPEPLCAGVAFSFDPVSGRRDQIVIDAAAGLGEAVVSGAVDPQRIVYRNVKGRLQREAQGGDSALLPPRHEYELAQQVFRMHWAFGDGQDPQDVEWAYDGRQIWFLQVRPATNTRRFLPAAVSTLPRHWSTANIKDAVPGVVSMLSWSVLKSAVDTVAFAGPIAAGYRLESGTELVRRFKGRGYFDLTLMQWVMYDALGLMPAQLVQSIGRHQPEIPVPGDPGVGAEGRRRMAAALRLMCRIWRIERDLDRVVNQRKACLDKVRDTDLTRCSTPELMAIYEKFELGYDSMDITAGIANSAEGPWELALEAMLKPLFGKAARPMIGKLLAGTGSVVSAEHGYAICDLASSARNDRAALEWLASGSPATEWATLPASSPFRHGLARFLDEFGHRAVYEADYLNPRWIEDPTYILDQVRFFLANPQRMAPREAAKRLRNQAEQAVRHAAGWRTPIIFWIIGRLRRAMAAREAAKSALAALVLPARRVALEIGRRLVGADS